MAKIAVEDSLDNVKDVLRANGHQVVSIDNFADSACSVISGQDTNVLGIADTSTKASVINAEGKTADQVLEQVNRVLQ